MAIRATKIEIWRMPEDRRDAWLHISEQVQRMTNRMWQIWLCHHLQNKSEIKIRSYLDALVTWRDTKQGKQGDKPKLNVQACGKELSNLIYHAISDEFADVTARTRGLCQNKWQGALSKRKASRGSLSGWMAILLANESLPSSTRQLPIPFDKMSSPRDTTFKKEDGKYWMTLRLERVQEDGKSVTDDVELILHRRKMSGVRTTVDRILDGTYQYKGSSVTFDSRSHKWFANISYDMPIDNGLSANLPAIDINSEIHLIPGKKSPWIVKAPSKKPWRAFGHGDHVVRMRQVIQRERWSRQEHNRWGSCATKGHGSNRAKSAWTKLSSRWKNFTKVYNREVAKRIVSIARSAGHGKIVYWQPKESKRDLMFLAKAGKHPRSAMTWDWFQITALIKARAEEVGIEVETREAIRSVRTVRTHNGRKPKERVERKRSAV